MCPGAVTRRKSDDDRRGTVRIPMDKDFCAPGVNRGRFPELLGKMMKSIKIFEDFLLLFVRFCFIMICNTTGGVELWQKS